MLSIILSYLAIGIVAGFFAGLLGVGGGLIMVPALVLLFQHLGMPRDVIFQLALGTSMASILFTSLSSLRAHHQHQAVLWPVVRTITPGILLGAGIGTFLARHLSVQFLALFFSGFMLYVALQMVLNFRPKPSRSLPGSAGIAAVGSVIGLVSALAAIGGGAMTVPFLEWCNVPLRRAIGTSAAVGFPIALGGSVGYVFNGWGLTGLPPWSLGFVYLPGLACILATSLLTAMLGAYAAHRLPARLLRLIFSGLLIVISSKMLYQLFA